MKIQTWLLAATLLVALCAPVMAQTFTDVPTDHWAYQAIQELSQHGLIIGYPDGTFAGKRALTRYEFAMAISRMLPVLRQMIKEEIGTPAAPTGGVSQSDFDALARRVDELEKRPAAQPGITQADLDRIRRLVDEFRDELATLGVDVDNLKRQVADLCARMAAVEESIRRLPRISAETNLVFRGENTINGQQSPIDSDGRTVDPAHSVLQGIRTLYDIDVRVEGNVSNSVVAHALFNNGNYVNWLNDQILGVGTNSVFYPNQNPGVSIPPYIAGFPVSGTDANDRSRTWLLYVDTPICLGPCKGAYLTVGKFPYQLSPYFLRQPDVDSYTYNYKTDSGDYQELGAAFNAKLGPVGINAFAAKQSDNSTPFVGGDGIPIGIAQTAGVRLSGGVPFLGNVALNYMQSGLNPLSFPAVDKVSDYAWWGADLNTVLPWYKIGITATWAQSQPQNTSGDIPVGFGHRTAVDARLSLPIGTFLLGGGYRKIDPNFSTPGYWGKIGYLMNPVSIEGSLATVSVPIFRKITFNALAEWYHGQGPVNTGLFPAGLTPPINIVPGTTIPVLNFGDKLDHYVAGFRYDLSSAYGVDLGYEEVRYRPAGEDVSRQNFINAGLGYSFNPNTSLKIYYQIIDQHNTNAATQPFWGPRSGQGGVAITQFSVRY